MDSCKNLKELQLSSYNPSTKGLHEIAVFHNLLKLFIYSTNISTLSGVQNFSSLKELEIWRAPKLQTISSLISLDKSLETISIESCKKITDYEILGNLRLLKRIRISNSGEIKSLSFIKKLHQLEAISFVDTNIIDGDLSYCEGISHVGFFDKKHYNRKSKDFEKR